MALLEFGFRIEEIHLARAAVHEQLDNRFRRRFMVRPARIESYREVPPVAFGLLAVEVGGKQRGESRALQAGTHPVEEVSPAERSGRLLMSGCVFRSHGFSRCKGMRPN